MNPILRIDLPESCRVLAVSDIHACHGLLDELLKRTKYNPDNDYLFILGDILEHGKESLTTLHKVMKLCDGEKAVMILGNNDNNILGLAFAWDYSAFMGYITRRPDNCYSEMARSIGITEFDEGGFDSLRERVNSAFAAELAFLKNLPLAIETERHIFVHAGIENRADWENTANDYALATAWWFRENHCAPKTVVVGHYPTFNYKESDNTNLPIIDHERRIIGIDGGLGIKWAAQLNLLVIGKSGGAYSYDTLWLPNAPERRVIGDYTADVMYKYCDVENSDLTVLGEKGELYRVRENYSGVEGLIPKCCTSEWGGRLHGWVNIDCFLSVSRSERFWLFGNIGEYAFGIAENGQVGLVPSEYID